MTFKNKYNELEKKFSLPSYEELNNDFEISSIEEEAFLLRAVRRKIAEKLDIYSKIIEQILMPESNQASILECQLFSQEEKNKIYSLFKRIMYFDRMSIETSINETEEKTAEFINKFYKEWNSIKEQLKIIFSELKQGWTKEFNFKEDNNYLG